MSNSGAALKQVEFMIMDGNSYWDDASGEMTDDPEEAAVFLTRDEAEEALQEARLELGNPDLEVVELSGPPDDDEEDEDDDLQEFADEFFLPEEEDPEELARRETREQHQAERAIRAAEGEFDPE